MVDQTWAKFQDLKRRTQNFVDTVLVGLPCRVVNGPGRNEEKLPWQKTVVALAVQQPTQLCKLVEENVSKQKQLWISTWRPWQSLIATWWIWNAMIPSKWKWIYLHFHQVHTCAWVISFLKRFEPVKKTWAYVHVVQMSWSTDCWFDMLDSFWSSACHNIAIHWSQVVRLKQRSLVGFVLKWVGSWKLRGTAPESKVSWISSDAFGWQTSGAL